MCSPPQVVFEGEDGKDDGGLTVDAFSRLFKCLYDNEALGIGALFEESSGGLVLPRPDKQLRGWVGSLGGGGGASGAAGGRRGTEPPKAKRQRGGGGGGGSGDGGGDSSAEAGGAGSEPQLSSEEVLRLVGRTLAKLLILGDGYHVSDRLPSFVLQLLTTDNCLLTPDEALEALREWDPETHAVVEERLKYSVAELAKFVDLPPPLRLCDLLPEPACRCHVRPNPCCGQREASGRWPQLRAEGCTLPRDNPNHPGGRSREGGVEHAAAAAAAPPVDAASAAVDAKADAKARADYAELMATLHGVKPESPPDAVAGAAAAAAAGGAEAEAPRCQSCAVLTDADLKAQIVDAVRHHLHGCRSGGLRALRQGFSGDDRQLEGAAAEEGQLDGRDATCHAFAWSLQALSYSHQTTNCDHLHTVYPLTHHPTYSRPRLVAAALLTR